MNIAIFCLYMMNLAYIALLPRIFFKRGSFHLFWWITALPFFICAISLIACISGFIAPWPWPYKVVRECISAVLGAISIALISYTLGTHKQRLALWHQKDEPQSIVTYGAYRYIRHPFYTAFQITLAGAFFYAPHPTTFLTLIYGCCILNFTARREEKFLGESNFGEEYREYIKRTGRFLPPVIRSRSL
jgi:protein-S-isoprenylcysteine O-methyltransferase Ste14